VTSLPNMSPDGSASVPLSDPQSPETMPTPPVTSSLSGVSAAGDADVGDGAVAPGDPTSAAPPLPASTTIVAAATSPATSGGGAPLSKHQFFAWYETSQKVAFRQSQFLMHAGFLFS
jgi:hypothetical protein